MSKQFLEEAIRAFLSNPEPGVLCIRGKWGTGKTYTWKSWLESAASRSELALKDYSYVSLYEVNSEADLRRAIVEKVVHLQAEATRVEEGSRLTEGVKWLRKRTPWIQRIGGTIKIPVVDLEKLGEAAAHFSYFSLKDHLICLDDIERHSPNLPLTSILGTATQLRDERGCKVVLLLNDGELDDTETQIFQSHLDKVANYDFLFDPTPEEAISITMENNAASPEEASLFLEYIRLNSIKLGISNIRLLLKIHELSLGVWPSIKDFGDRVKHSAAHIIVLATWCRYRNKDAPPLIFLETYNGILWAARRRENRKTHGTTEEENSPSKYQNELTWSGTLSAYGHIGTGDFDRCIIEGVISGYFNGQQLHKLGVEIEEKYRERRSPEKFDKVWSEDYHGSLKIGDDEFSQKMLAAAMAEAEFISVDNVNSAIFLLRELGLSKEISTLVDHYVDVHKDTRSVLDFRKNAHLDGEIDKELGGALDKARIDLKVEGDPFETLLRMGEKRVWSELDIELLATVSTEDFKKFFRELSGEPLRQVLNVCRTFRANPRSSSGAIYLRVLSALQHLSEESTLNRIKLVGWGFEFPNENDEKPQKP